ncbi:MAG: hypothetical protein WBA41_22420 [Rivularia sp. (in: cyanobacteria)]
MKAAFDFLVNTAGGLLMNLGVSGMVGQLMGIGATLALHPELMNVLIYFQTAPTKTKSKWI